MLFSDEDLITYLLGDASDELSQRLHQRLPIDSDLAQRLTALRLMLGQINATQCIFEPPADLVDTTLQRIDESLIQPSQSPAQRGQSQTSYQSTEPAEFASLPGQPRRRPLWDSMALTVSLMLLSCMVLPALVRIRFESRKAQCARNLELTGSELISYALNHPQGRFPHVALDGPQAFAGVYAIHLRQAGGQVPSSQLRCPSLIGCDSSKNPTLPDFQGAEDSVSPSSVASITSFSELHSLTGDKLQLAQQTVGGDFAYNLGVSERGKPQAPKLEGRSQFAILADAPVLRSAARQPNAERLEHFIAHEGKGINIFYEDGHVEFVTSVGLRSLILSNAQSPDNPFQNQLGAHELGVHPHDASLAPSSFPPLSN